MSNEHQVKYNCDCEYCDMIDQLYCLTALTGWESKFVKNMSMWGYDNKFTDKQQETIRSIYDKHATILMLVKRTYYY